MTLLRTLAARTFALTAIVWRGFGLFLCPRAGADQTGQGQAGARRHQVAEKTGSGTSKHPARRIDGRPVIRHQSVAKPSDKPTSILSTMAVGPPTLTDCWIRSAERCSTWI